MPEVVAPAEYHCGTHDPIWLKDSHPTQADGNVVREACITVLVLLALILCT